MKKNIITIVLVLMFVATLVVYVIIQKKKKEDLAKLGTPLLPGVVPATATQPIIPQNNNTGYTVPVYNGPSNTSALSNPVLVKLVQAALGLTVDGKYGPKTQAAIAASNFDISNQQAIVDKLISVDGDNYAKFFPIKKGDRNNYVKALQIALNIKADGIFGSGTETALVKAIGKKQCYHLDLTKLFTNATGITIKYNDAKIVKPKKNWYDEIFRV